MRAMTLEAYAGKNPVNHVGKLLSMCATRIAEACVALDGVQSAECVLVSEIGRPITEPQAAGVRLDAPPEAVAARAERVRSLVRDAVTALPDLWREIVGPR
jgi:S-adenosylmethionine synthetase